MNFFKKIPLPIIFSALLVLLFVLHVAVLSPIIFKTSTDVMYDGSYLPFALETLLELVYLAVYVVTFSFISLAVIKGGAKRGLVYLAVFFGLTVFRYGLNIFCSYLYEGGIPSSSEVIMSDILDGSLTAVLDTFQAAFCLAVTAFLLSKSKKRYSAALKWAKKHGDERKAEEYNNMKWQKIFGLSNPVQLSLFLSGALISLTKIISRMIYDISLTQIEGAPSSSEIPIMIAYYASDIVFGLLIYLACVMIAWERGENKSSVT